MHFSPLGDQAVTITLGDSIDEATHRRVRAVVARLDRDRPAGMIDVVPAFASVTVHYDPAAVGGDAPVERIVARLTDLLSNLGDEALPAPRVVEVPVCYGEDLGPDLHDVAARHGMTEDEVVRVHTARGWVVLASDASHYYDNIYNEAPFPVVHDVGAMLAGHRRLMSLGETPGHVVPGHDPLVMQRFPRHGAPGDEIVALHLDPIA